MNRRKNNILSNPTGIPVSRLVKILVFAFLGGVPLGHAAASVSPGVFYVSVNGRDQWSGTRPNPNFSKSDGPFASVERAVEAVRDWRKRNSPTSEPPATIHLGPGVYEL